MIGLCLKFKSLYVTSPVGLDAEGIIFIEIPGKDFVVLESYVTVFQVRTSSVLFLM